MASDIRQVIGGLGFGLTNGSRDPVMGHPRRFARATSNQGASLYEATGTNDDDAMNHLLDVVLRSLQ